MSNPLKRTSMQIARRFGLGERGLAAIEFALVLPLLLSLYAGTVIYYMSFKAREEAESATVALSDALSRYVELSNSDLRLLRNVHQNLVGHSEDRPSTFVVKAVERRQTAGADTPDDTADDTFVYWHQWSFNDVDSKNRSKRIDQEYTESVPEIAPGRMMYVVSTSSTPQSFAVMDKKVIDNVEREMFAFPRFASKIVNTDAPEPDPPAS